MSKLSKEQKLCPVLNTTWFTGNELMSKDDKELDRTTLTGYAFCPEVQKMIDQGHVVLVEIDKSKSVAKDPANPKEYEALGTGKYLYIDQTTAYNLFGAEQFSEKPMAFIESDTYDTLVRGMEKGEVNEDEMNLD